MAMESACAFRYAIKISVFLQLLVAGSLASVRKCPKPVPPENGHVMYHSERSNYVMFRCDPTYELKGSRSALCMFGRWSPEPPTCVPLESSHHGTDRTTSAPVIEAPAKVRTTPCPYKEKKSLTLDVRRRSAEERLRLAPGRSLGCRLPPPPHNAAVVLSRNQNHIVIYCETQPRLAVRINCYNGVWDRRSTLQCPGTAGYRQDDVLLSASTYHTPCEDNYGGCAQICVYREHGHYCSCKYGYRPNGTECIDIDECAEGTHRCEKNCVNTPGGHRCQCPEGYKLARNKRTCEDIDECQANNGGCQERCINQIGSFRCHCTSPGYSLAQDGKKCKYVEQRQQPPNQCKENNGGCQYECSWDGRKVTCSCPQGYYLDRYKKCIDIDECAEGTHKCQKKCVNTYGGHRCQCPDGYKLDRDNTSCVDIDECQANNGGCQEECINQIGSFRCHCTSPGYSLAEDGKRCKYAKVTRKFSNPCKIKNGGCSHNCGWNGVKVVCSCPAGFHLHGKNMNICRDTNECRRNKGGCEHQCVNTVGSHVCRCYKGYKPSPEDRKKCIDIRGCSNNNGRGPCEDRCHPLPGGKQECSCSSPGLKLADNGVSCVDIDECNDGNNFGCSHVCQNVHTSAHCLCPPGLKLSEDNKTCAGPNNTFMAPTVQGLFSLDGCSPNGGKGPCEERCQPLPNKGYRCSCISPGMKLSSDGVSCVDLEAIAEDEFQYIWPRNYSGSFNGSDVEDEIEGSGLEESPFREEDAARVTKDCPIGFSFVNGTCQDIDECFLRATNLCAHKCENTPGSFRCSCNEGYRLDATGTGCADINECDSPSTHSCSHECKNTPGSYSCTCPRGYQLDSKRKCIDVDECSTRQHSCSEICENFSGGYRCKCSPGRISYNTRYCQDCPKNTFKDSHGEACIACPPNSHTNASRKTSIIDCMCDNGFRKPPNGGQECEDINECDEKILKCSHDCFNTKGSAHCLCPRGIRLSSDGLTCEADTDECTETPHICNQICKNTFGGYECSCKTGYTLSIKDNFTCADENECTSGNHNCSHICTNFDGGYYCECPKGFKMTGDLTTCTEVTCPMFLGVPDANVKCSPDASSGFAKAGTTCAFRCNGGYRLEGEKTTKCTENATWTNEIPSCKPMSCEPLAHPENGRVMPERCLSPDGNHMGSKCYVQCDSGYVKNGVLVNICVKLPHVNELRWKYGPATCQKAKATPSMSCPPDVVQTLPPGASEMHVMLPPPNTNLDPSLIQVSPGWLKKHGGIFSFGEMAVTYLANDTETGITINCTFMVDIRDLEPPKIEKCPETVSALATTLDGAVVSWDEPEFSDNVEIDEVRKTQYPGTTFTIGVHTVHYTARDISGNEATCQFQVNVTRKECKFPADIEHGSTACYHWIHGVLCEPICNEGYAFPSNVSIFYSCDLNGVWEPRSWIPDCQEYTQTQTQDCLPGAEFFDELDGESNVCLECPAGMYRSAEMAQCHFCERGYYQDQPGQSACKPCPSSQFEVPVQSALLDEQCFS